MDLKIVECGGVLGDKKLSFGWLCEDFGCDTNIPGLYPFWAKNFRLYSVMNTLESKKDLRTK